MLRLIVLTILASFSTDLANGVELVVVGGNSAFCSGASVTLQCTLTGDVLTWNTPDGALNFIRGRASESDDGSYHGRLLENSTHLRSNLTFTFTSQITISCSDGSENTSLTISIEGPPSAPDRPLTALDKIERLNKTFSSVTVVWSIPDTNNARISSYEVTVVPSVSLPASGVIAADSPLFQTRQLTLTLQHDRQYYITVRAKSCHDTVEGEVSSPLSINVQVPPNVTRCTALPVYDYYSNTLKRIDIEWDTIPDVGEDITDGITASVKQYIISAVPIGLPAPEINSTLEASNSSVCTRTACKTTFESISEMSALYYSVMVTAKNLLTDGYSERQVCSNTTISPRNDLLSVAIRRNMSDVVQVLCRPLTRFEGRASCEVTYSTIPNTVNMVKSESVGGARDIITVLLMSTAGPEVTLTVAAATRGGKQDVVVEGTFETGDIVSSNEILMRHLCPENETKATTESTEEPSMANTSTTECSNTPWILAGGIFIISLLIGFVSGITLMVIRSKRRKTETRGNVPVYEYVTSKDILLESNKCYTTKPAPKLPKPREV